MGTGIDGLRDGSSRLLDGTNTGQPRSECVTTLTWRNPVLPALYLQRKGAAPGSIPTHRKTVTISP